MRKILLSLLFAFSVSSAWGATYYVSPSGDNGNDGLSSGAAWATFTYAFTQMAGGDTLYAVGGSTTSPSTWSTDNIVNPPSGSAGNLTQVLCTENYTCLIDGDDTRGGISIGSSGSTREYVEVGGFVVKNCGGNSPLTFNSPDGTSDGSESRYNYVHDMILWGEQDTGGASLGMYRTQLSTVTNVAVWGLGRYTFQTYGAKNNYFKNIIVRWDGYGVLSAPSKPNDPRSPVGIYNSKDNIFDNLLVIDRSSFTTTGRTSGTDIAGVYLPSNNTPATSNFFDSSSNTFNNLIILNGENGYGFINEGWVGGTGNNGNLVNNMVIWDNKSGGISNNRYAKDNDYFNITVSSVGWGGSGHSVTAGGTSTSGIAIKNAQVIDNYSSSGNGINGSDWDNTYCNVYNIPGSDYSGTSADATDISSAATFVYVTTVSATTAGFGLGESGGDIGANTVYAYDEGALTGSYMFPFNNEQLIWNYMCVEDTRRGTTGLCGVSTTTAGGYPIQYYVENYLGNGFIGQDVDISSPTAPGIPTVISTGTTTFDLSWSASTDDTGVTDYRVDVSIDSGFGSFVGSYQDHSNGTSTTIQLTGLSESTQYFFRIRAKDATGNTSSNSSTGQGTTSTTPTGDGIILKTTGGFDSIIGVTFQ